MKAMEIKFREAYSDERSTSEGNRFSVNSALFMAHWLYARGYRLVMAEEESAPASTGAGHQRGIF